MTLKKHAKTPIEILHETRMPKGFDNSLWVPFQVAEAEIQKFRDKNVEFIRDISELNGKIASAQKILDSLTKKFYDDLVKNIIALPNMGDEGRKAKLLAVYEWKIEFEIILERLCFTLMFR